MSAELDLAALSRRIVSLQDADGHIRWIDGGVFDPWNHCESAMGLAVAGEFDAARAALRHLRETQRADGSWDGEMGCAAPLDMANEHLVPDALARVVDTNFCAYPAVAAWHLALISGQSADLSEAAPMVARACEWVLAHQREDGAFAWRAVEAGEDLNDVGALRAGSSSIYKSLECAARLLAATGRASDHLLAARARLGRTLRLSDETTWVDTARYAMDWYYPVLCGALGDSVGRARLALHWRRFVDRTWGCRCVVDEPWTTAAETAELAMACARAGAPRAAERLLAATARHTAPDGDLWMGRQIALDVVWPRERPSWTAGAALIAQDVVVRRTPGAAVFLETLPETAPAAALIRSA